MSELDASRRRFLLTATAAAGSLPILMTLGTRPAQAALPPLPSTNAQAKALSYTEDASTVKNAMYKAGSTCANCQFFVKDTGGCSIFPGFSVAPKGWCSAWAAAKA